jgi:RNA polymerase sigma-70 factor (ECF subfamily)
MAHLFAGPHRVLSILTGSPSGLSEEDSRILRGLRAGFEESYEELIQKYEQPVYCIVYRLVGNRSDACDVTQEVFLKVFRGVGSFREQSSLRTWIYRIAINEAHNHRRWWTRHCRWEVPIEKKSRDHETNTDVLPDPGRSPFDQVLDAETRALVESALARIKPVFRTAVVLRDIETMSYEEIADILQVNLGTVKSRIQRGREALRRELFKKADGRLKTWPELSGQAVGDNL